MTTVAHPTSRPASESQDPFPPALSRQGSPGIPPHPRVASRQARTHDPSGAGLEAGCTHHWLIEQPNGAQSLGVCKHCGAQQDFWNVEKALRGELAKGAAAKACDTCGEIKPANSRYFKRQAIGMVRKYGDTCRLCLQASDRDRTRRDYALEALG